MIWSWMHVTKFMFCQLLGLYFTATLHLIFVPQTGLANEHNCSQMFFLGQIDKNSSRQPTLTTEFMQYLVFLFEDSKLLKMDDLVRFNEGLKRGEIINPLQYSRTTSNGSLNVHQRGLQDYIDTGELNVNYVLGILESYLSSLAQQADDIAQVRGETTKPSSALQFKELDPGTVLIKREDAVSGFKTVNVRLTKKVLVSISPITQQQWVDIMGANPSVIGESCIPSFTTVNGRDIELCPDSPVTNLTWWSAIVFANELSRKNNLPVAYNIDRLTMFEVPAGRGAYVSPENNFRGKDYDQVLSVAARGNLGRTLAPKLPEINAPRSNIYETKGYRLLTYAEMVLLAKALAANPDPKQANHIKDVFHLVHWWLQDIGSASRRNDIRHVKDYFFWKKGDRSRRMYSPLVDTLSLGFDNQSPDIRPFDHFPAKSFDNLGLMIARTIDPDEESVGK